MKEDVLNDIKDTLAFSLCYDKNVCHFVFVNDRDRRRLVTLSDKWYMRKYGKLKT